MLYKEHAAKAVEAAIEKARDAHTGTSDAVKHILINTCDSATDFGSLTNWKTLPPPDVSVYDQIGGVL